MNAEKGIKFICDLCGQMIEVGRPRFVLRGELYGAYDGGTFDETPSTPPAEMRKEIERLIALMEQRSEKELTDEVHYAFELDLCSACRSLIYRLLDRRPWNLE
ncbi:MAG TPA: hypothetical protein PK878_06420 [bacterium]|nr:hypothetical protein [bacterium]HPP01962.1 hypothetical protein [bacterium]HXK94795.1 hypothetical protein [bacterium]